MRRDDKGQVLVEFALVTFVLLSVIFAIVDLAFMFYVNLTMQHAVREGSRYAVTGQSDAGSDRTSSVIKRIRDNSNGLYDKNLHSPKDPQFSVITPSQVSFTNYSGTPTNGTPGTSNDIVVVSLTYTGKLLTPLLKPFFPDGQYTFTVRSTMRNEP